MRRLLAPLLLAALCFDVACAAPRRRSRVTDAAVSLDGELRPVINPLLAAAGPALRPVENDARLRKAATAVMVELRQHQQPAASPQRTGDEAPQMRELWSRDGALTVRLKFAMGDVNTPAGVVPLRCWMLDEVDKAHGNAARGGTLASDACLVPAPTLRVRPGDLLTLIVRNTLPATSSRCQRAHLATEPEGNNAAECENTFHAPNTLNVHTHGLHVSPLFDDVFVAQGPGTTRTYRFPIERDHAPGMSWWHPHYHGSGSLHLASGAAGALIVDPLDGGDADSEAFADERVLVMQEQRFNGLISLLSVLKASFAADYEAVLAAVAPACGFDVAKHNPSGYDAQLNPSCTYITINGALRPTLRLRSGAWTRLRVVAATWTGVAALAIRGAGCTASMLALDGIPLRPGPMPLSEAGGRVLLGPGQRVDLAVRCEPSSDGDAALVAMPRDAAVDATFGSWFQQFLPNDVTQEPLVLADIALSPPLTLLGGAAAVAGISAGVPALPQPQSSYLADDLRLLPVAQRHSWFFDARLLCLRMNASNCERLPGDDPASTQRGLAQRLSDRFQASVHPTQYIAGFDADGLDDITSIFWINGEVYRGAGAPALTARVGEVQEWELRAGWVSPHVVHLHATPFQLLSYEPAGGDDSTQRFMAGQWMDGVLVPAGGRVVLRVRFAAEGPTLLHCHTLLHHDVGMAAVVDVKGAAAP